MKDANCGYRMRGELLDKKRSVNICCAAGREML